MKVIKKLELSRDFNKKLLKHLNECDDAATVKYVRRLIDDAFNLGVHCNDNT